MSLSLAQFKALRSWMDQRQYLTDEVRSNGMDRTRVKARLADLVDVDRDAALILCDLEEISDEDLE